MELNSKLLKLGQYPFHMPGHKRNEKFNILGSNIDITEIDGFDNLHNANDCLLKLENDFSKLYKSKKSFLSVNGSTCCILSSISAVCNNNEEIIIARNCHKSVYNACFINQLNVHYIVPKINEDFNCFENITQSQIDEAVRLYPNSKAIVLTSPTYEGIISDIKADIPIIVDAAHGAHFGFNANFPNYPVGDIVVSSLHKTLPALTQTAIVNIYNLELVSKVKKYMDIYESSSPSYVLLNSIDKCRDFLFKSDDEFNKLSENLDTLMGKISELKSFTILKNDDKSRICIKSKKLNGNKLATILRQDYNIEVEMSCASYIIIITSVGDEKYAFDLLFDALEDIDNKYNNLDNKDLINTCINYSLPNKICNSFEIDEKDCNFVYINKSVDLTSCEYIYAYPPGIPIIVPGEKIDNNIIEYINFSINNGTNIISDSGFVNHKILTKGLV